MLKVSKNTLILITGFVWLLACLILFRRAYSWIAIMTDYQLYLGILIAIPLAIIKIRFIFKKLTIKNIKRISSFKEHQINVWEFHLNKDKILIVLMIVLGTLLRNTPFIPKYILFPVYIGIGLAMFYVTILYISEYIKEY